MTWNVFSTDFVVWCFTKPDLRFKVVKQLSTLDYNTYLPVTKVLLQGKKGNLSTGYLWCLWKSIYLTSKIKRISRNKEKVSSENSFLRMICGIYYIHIVLWPFSKYKNCNFWLFQKILGPVHVDNRINWIISKRASPIFFFKITLNNAKLNLTAPAAVRGAWALPL